jgi:hypothetical protein
MFRATSQLATSAIVAFCAACPSQAGTTVPFAGGFSPGSIVIKTGERRLYYVLGDRTAVRYSVAVGRAGKQWAEQVYVSGKFVRPAWSPPWEVRRDNPRLPHVIPGGAPNNPNMGAAALTLSGGGEYAIVSRRRRRIASDAEARCQPSKASAISSAASARSRPTMRLIPLGGPFAVAR